VLVLWKWYGCGQMVSVGFAAEALALRRINFRQCRRATYLNVRLSNVGLQRLGKHHAPLKICAPHIGHLVL
jgi:inhibitor of KinA sporulation pathway (predicted exonuclease)